MNTAAPRLLLAIEKLYNRYTSFPRGRFACSEMIFWGVRHLGFKVPLLRLTSGIIIEYSASVARDVVMRDLLLTGSFEPDQSAHAHSKPVSLTTVDDFVAQARIDRVDLIKIDTEGSGLEVLKSVGNILTTA